MAQVQLDSPTHSPSHSPVQSPRRTINLSSNAWKQRNAAAAVAPPANNNSNNTSSSSQQQQRHDKNNSNSNSDPFLFEEGENSNGSLLMDTTSQHNQQHSNLSMNMLLMEQQSQQSQQSQSQGHSCSQQSHSQAMSEILTQNADFTQMTQDADTTTFSLSPTPNSPVKPEKIPWGRLMPCSGGKAIELLPRAPTEEEKASLPPPPPLSSLGNHRGQGVGGTAMTTSSLLGLQGLYPSDQFNEFWLGRSQKCDVRAPKPKSRNPKEQKLQEWGFGLISNKHAKIYCTLSEDAVRSSRQNNNNNNNNPSTSMMEVWVEDSSNNGTMINQSILLKRGQKRRLHSGDEVSLLNPETLHKRIPDDKTRQHLLQQHSFLFVNVAHLHEHQQQQQQQSKPRGMPMPSSSSAPRPRRGIVNPRAMNYQNRNNRGGVGGGGFKQQQPQLQQGLQQQQQQQQQRSPVPAFPVLTNATKNSAFSGPPGKHPYSESKRTKNNNAFAATNSARATAAAAASSTSPRRIEAEYDIRDLLGRGTCGEVRRAIHRRSGQERAVKIVSLPSPGLMNNSQKQKQDTQQWQAEARILQTLEHPYIVQLVDVFCTDTHLYLVMELSSGGDLFDRIVQRGKYTETASRRVMRRLLSAIHYIHEDAEIVHRDLKPENILLNASDIDVKITDFGVAKNVSGGLKTLCGTPGYLAPEVLKRQHTVLGHGRYGKPADMWSLGVILFILLSGTPPFDVDGVQDMEVVLQAGNKVHFHPKHWSSISEDGIDLVKRLLAMDPRKRISIREACEHSWVMTEDGDTHQHPLEDPKLFSVTKKRLFSAPGSPVPTPVSTVVSSLHKTPAPKRMKLEEEPTPSPNAQTIEEAAAENQEQAQQMDGMMKEDTESTATAEWEPSTEETVSDQQLEADSGTEPDKPSSTNDDSDGRQGSKKPFSNEPERVSSKLAESMISRIMQPQPKKEKTSAEPLKETSNVHSDSAAIPMEDVRKSEQLIKGDNAVKEDKAEMGSKQAIKDELAENTRETSPDTPSRASTTVEDPESPEEKSRRVTPAGANQEISTDKATAKISQATHHFEPGAATAAAAKAKTKPSWSKKAKEKGLVMAAELEEDKICSQFSDDDTESISSFGDAITVEKEADESDEEGKPSKTYKQSTLVPLPASGTAPTVVKKQKKAALKPNAGKPKAAKANATIPAPKFKRPAEKKTTTTIVHKKKSSTNTTAKSTNSKKSAPSTKDTTTKKDASDSGKAAKQTTLAKWFQPKP